MEALTSLEKQRARDIAEEYRSQGYEVIEEPSPGQLPDFLFGYRPDLLIRKGNEAIIVEVKSRTSLARNPQVQDLARILQPKPHWNFELVIVEEGDQFHTLQGAQPLGRDDIQQGVEKALKAVLASRNLEIGRTHDLNKLFYQIKELSLACPVNLEELSKLNPYAVTVRYDDQEVDTVTINEAEIILTAILQWAATTIHAT